MRESIIDNEVESELAKSDDGDHSFMECEENDLSDGSSSLDLSLKKISSKMVNQAQQQIVCKIPKAKDFETIQEDPSPLLLDENLKLIELKNMGDDLADICINCHICMQ